MIITCRILLVCAIVIYFVQCSPQDEPVTKAEALAIAKKIDSCIRYKKPSSYGMLFNKDVFEKRIKEASNQSLPAGSTESIKKEIQNNSLGSQVITSLGKDGHYELVKHYEKNKTQHLLFRLFSTSGINYHDYELTKAREKIGIADIYVYTTGENLSKSLANFIINANKIIPIDSKIKSVVTQIQTIKILISKGDYEQAKKLHDKMPAEIKKDKLFQLLNLQICSELPGDAYEKAVADLEKSYADNPDMSLIFLDAYYLRKDYRKALATINKLDSVINSDPLLDYYRALTYNMMDSTEKAVDYFEQLYRTKPGFQPAALELITHYLSEGDYVKATPIVKAYRKRTEFDQESLEVNLSLYPDFTE